MATTLRAFNTGLYEEHLEEISFLYEQRGALLKKPGFGWQDLAPFEARLEAHLDALVVGRELALEVCQRLAREGDFGQLFGAVSIYCRQKQVSLLASALKGLDFANDKKVAALTDALKFELPHDWASFIAQSLARQEARLTPILAAVAGYRRLDGTAPALAHALSRTSPDDTAQARLLVEALGRQRARDSHGALTAYLPHPDAALRNAALLALLRCGSQDAIEPALAAAVREPWPHTPLALAAERAASNALVQSFQAGNPAPESLLAVGLLGDPATLRLLYDKLGEPESAKAAAQALQWITGAALDAEVFVPEEVDEAVLFKTELQAWKQYKHAPTRLNGQPFGELAKTLVVDKETWKRWFTDNASRFDPALRYRNGKPVSPRTLLGDLAAPDSSTLLRRHTALELEIRYGCDVAFEVDMTVAAQVDAMRRIAAWVQANEARFEAGRWYFNGGLQ